MPRPLKNRVDPISDKAKKGGVQIEITFQLLKKLEENDKYLSKFINAVRSAIQEEIYFKPASR